MDDLIKTLTKLKEKVATIKTKLDLGQKHQEISQLEAQTASSDFWTDESRAREVMKRLTALKDELDQLQKLEEQLNSLLELAKLSQEKAAESLKQDLSSETDKLTKAINQFELTTFLSGAFDQNEAILSLHAGQGGTEAMDWTLMLLRMYTRYFDQKNWPHELVDQTPGEETGLKTVTLIVHHSYAYGFLKGEKGTHRLVRLSPFNADNLRQTSFALVEVLPLLPSDTKITINPADLEWQFFRSGGHGGQNVNKVNTAARVTHRPTGITVTSQEQRYQEQNRKIALSILQAKIWQAEEEKKEQTIQKIKGKHKIAGWGNQIRSYVLHPYHLVKDLRTQVETSNTDAVLNGDLDIFIEAEIISLASLGPRL